jgi:outer membrane receptor protein involved in Fe transport
MSKAALMGAAMVLGVATQAHAQEAAEDRGTQTAEDIVVLGNIQYRDRIEGAPPVLEYGLDFFQRFEPRTVGDMLKRTPSAAFAGSDIGEYDDLQLRGLGAGYTQVLINGERAPGSGFDRTFFVDRIPAELVERVEIVRSSSANRSGDAVAGALNIVMRDGYSLDGGYVRGGAQLYSDDEVEGLLGVVYGGEVGPARVLLGFNYQGRHNPKDKFSERFDEPGGSLDNIEVQSDVRDGEDYTFNGSVFLPVGEGELQLSGVYVRTDREEIENSAEYEGGDLTTLVPGFAFIEQSNMALGADFEHPLFGGKFEVDLGFARFEEDSTEGETETSFDGGLAEAFEGGEERLNFTDEEWTASVGQEFALGGETRFEVGVDYSNRLREGIASEREFEIDGPPPYAADPYTDPNAETDEGLLDGGDFEIEERRIDPYVMLSGVSGRMQWETGLRYEMTELDVTDRDEGETASNDYNILLPSAHLRFELSEDNRLNFSVARTVRRPNFREIMPTTFEGEFEDNDFVGNPEIDPETAWGIDVGFERRLGRAGVFGVNFFYRDVQDVIELYNTGTITDDFLDDYQDWLDDGNVGAIEDFVDDEGDPIVYEYSIRNTGDGAVWGAEVDLSTPLTMFGLEDTGVFVNYSWLDSEIDDEFGSRRFNNQSEYVFNVGFIHDMPTLNSSFGATYRQQGDAFTRILGEEVSISYGADLELFVEHRIGERFSLRLTGSNLLDSSKDEVFDKFLTEADQLARNYDEYELETETAGPVFQLVGRYAF